MPTRIKRYEERLDNLDTLLARIELEMGPQAQLEAREFRRSTLLGLGGQRMVEIIATLQLDERQQTGNVAADPQPQPVATSEAARWAYAAPFSSAASLMDSNTEQLLAGGAQDRLEISGQQGPDAMQSGNPVAHESIDDPAARLSAAFGRRVAQSKSDPLPRSQGAGSPHRELAEPDNQPIPRPDASAQTGVELDELRGSLADIRRMLESVASQQQSDRQLLEQSRREREMPPRPQTELDRLQETFRLQLEAREDRVAQAEPEPPSPVSPVLQAITAAMQLSEAARSVFQRLLEWNIPAEDSLRLMQTALEHCPADIGAAELQTEVSREICRGILLKGGLRLPKGERRVVALVGPTGVGKTTTIAKLAARAVFEEGHSVAVISLDNYRIAAVEQLRSYAEIMGIRFEVVFAPEEFRSMLDELRDYDLVLVDTAGRSPGSAAQIAESAELFSSCAPDEVHLVMTAGTLAQDMQQIIDNFAPLNCDQLIISKLDETKSLGGIYNLSRLCSLPVSYFTVGQSVPEDIRSADPDFVNDWMNRGVTIK